MPAGCINHAGGPVTARPLARGTPERLADPPSLLQLSAAGSGKVGVPLAQHQAVLDGERR